MQSNSNIPLIHVEDLKKRLDAGEKLVILDVREPHEYQICNIGGTLIPLGQLQQRINELDPRHETIVHCRGGVRAADACQFLLQSGFMNVKNLAGGILAWAEKIDPTMKKY
jgi:sulfur-carrier protein adenylyltransferase/sulfurtransferase